MRIIAYIKSKITLLDNWKDVMLKSWSARLSALSALASGYLLAFPEVLTSAWQMLPPEARTIFPRHYLIAIPLILSLLAYWARGVKQERLNND